MFSLKRLEFSKQWRVTGLEEVNHMVIFPCVVSFDLKIRGCFLEEVSVALGLNGPAEMAFHPGQKLL